MVTQLTKSVRLYSCNNKNQPKRRPKHVGENIVNEIHHKYWSENMLLFIYILYLINALKMEHTKITTTALSWECQLTTKAPRMLRRNATKTFFWLFKISVLKIFILPILLRLNFGPPFITSRLVTVLKWNKY
jgi:hypothetical protein